VYTIGATDSLASGYPVGRIVLIRSGREIRVNKPAVPCDGIDEPKPAKRATIIATSLTTDRYRLTVVPRPSVSISATELRRPGTRPLVCRATTIRPIHPETDRAGT